MSEKKTYRILLAQDNLPVLAKWRKNIAELVAEVGDDTEVIVDSEPLIAVEKELEEIREKYPMSSDFSFAGPLFL